MNLHFSRILNSICVVCSTIFLTQPVYAKKMESSLGYAAPCEAVLPQSQLLKNIQQQLKLNPQYKQKTIESFWQSVQQHGTPYIEKVDENQSRVIYLWRGATHNARLVGGPSNDHEWLSRLPNSDIWFKESIVNHQFIGSYSFAVDLLNIDGYLSHYCPYLNPDLKESRAQRRALLQVQKIDPFNPNRFFEDVSRTQFRNENILTLSKAPQFIDQKKYNSHPQPKLRSYTLHSNILNNERLVQIYQSERHNPKQDYITAIFFDGQQYAELLNVPKALDILVKQGKLPPIQAVFVSHPSDELRPKELTPNAKYSAFFAQELLPWLDQQSSNGLHHPLQFKRNKDKTVLLGSSLGGLSSAYLALNHPKEISHVVPLSGSFWWKAAETDVPNGMSKIIRERKFQPMQHWYIAANSYETSRNNNELSILETSPMVAQDLKNKGHDVHYQSYIGGHSYAIWQVVLQDALLHFFAKPIKNS